MSVAMLLGLGLLGGVGAIARFLLDGAVAARAVRDFPYGTLAVNLSGSLLLGVLVGTALDEDALRLAGIGFLGAFTTFSTWALESHRLGEDGELRLGALNFAVSRVLGGRRGLARARDRDGTVNEDCLKLTVLFGERGRANGGFLADALIDIYARHELQTSLVMRGIEGFGVKHHLHTDRLLTLSEDLPLVTVAVDMRERIQAALRDVEALSFDGLVTLERARMLTGRVEAIELPPDLHEATKLTIYVGRQERAGGRAAHRAVVDLLHRRGVSGATVLFGVDGTAHGVRRRATFFGRNAEVPLMIIAVGEGRLVAETLPELGAMLERPLLTLERVRVCKRDGVRLAEPRQLPQTDEAGLGVWQKLMIYAGGQAQHAGRPLYHQIVRALRAEGAAGATCLRGIWGYHGDHQPHGDSFWQLRRGVPVVTVVVDVPDRMQRWFAIVDELTDETGLVTSEMVPAYQAKAPDLQRGGLRLARRLTLP